MKFLKALILLIVIPIFGFGVSQWVLHDLNVQIAKKNVNLTINKICSSEMVNQSPSLIQLCREVKPILWMQDLSVYSGIVGILLLKSFVLFAIMAGKDRARISKIFPPLVFGSLFVLSGLVLIQGVILTYGAFLAESTVIHRVHFVL